MEPEPGDVWRQAGYAEADGALLLARNVAMLEAVGRGQAPPTLRWYRYERACVVLGYGQTVRAVDPQACAAHGVAVLRRPAGGSAVLADRGLLGLAIALPLPHPLALADLTESYRWLGETLAAALAGLGIPTQLVSIAEARADAQAARAAADEADRVRSLACFGTFSPYEVAVGQRKLVGLAQVRRGHAALYQVGFLLRSSTALLAQLLACSPAERAALARALEQRTVDLHTLLGREVEPQQIIAAVERELQARWRVRLVPAPLTAEEEAAAHEALSRVVQLPLEGGWRLKTEA
ncbi:MAG: ligase [Chloroflexi bacterium]|nr:ligase [Chloroflexota bacterium]